MKKYGNVRLELTKREGFSKTSYDVFCKVGGKLFMTRFLCNILYNETTNLFGIYDFETNTYKGAYSIEDVEKITLNHADSLFYNSEVDYPCLTNEARYELFISDYLRKRGFEYSQILGAHVLKGYDIIGKTGDVIVDNLKYSNNKPITISVLNEFSNSFGVTLKLSKLFKESTTILDSYFMNMCVLNGLFNQSLSNRFTEFSDGKFGVVDISFVTDTAKENLKKQLTEMLELIDE